MDRANHGNFLCHVDLEQKVKNPKKIPEKVNERAQLGKVSLCNSATQFFLLFILIVELALSQAQRFLGK